MPPFVLALLSSGLRLVANAALVKGKEFIQEKTGVDLDQAALSTEDQAKLRQFQAEHEEELLRLQLEDNKLGLEETKAFLADVADARKIQSEIQMSANAPWYAKAIQPTLAAFTLLATILLFGMFVYWSGDITEVVDGKHTLVKRINDTQKDIIIYILGVLSAAVTQILGYYFGSSQGSATKSRSLDKVLAQTTSGAEK
jgi:hypothetical protein